MDMLELADKLESLPASTDAEGAHTANAAVAAPPDEIAARQALGLAGRTLPGETAVSRRAAHAAAEGFAEALASGEGSTDVLASSNRVADALASSLYGTFFLARVELALPVEAIQEVVTFPARVTTIPLAPAFLIGVFNLRGTIVPVIRLATLLGMTGQDGADADARTSKVAIVDLDGLRVGLVFDTTGDMLRVPAADRHAFRYTHDAPHPVIQGALKLAGGERIVQVLDPAALLRIEQVPRILDKQRASGPRRHSALAQRRQCVSFRLGCTALAFEIGAIHEIIRVPVVQASVLRSEHCVGMFTLRGNVMPLVDFGALLGMPRADAAAEVAGMADERRIIVMRLGERHVGLLVDRVDSIVGFAAHDVLPIPTLGLRRGAMFAGWIGRASIDDIVLLKHDAVLASAELAALTQGHSHLYASDDAQGAKQRARGERQVFITFRLDNLMAAPIADIREIIRHPDEILTPPGLPPAVYGMLNLRRRLVTIVDLRALYELRPRDTSAAARAQAKILIVERGDDAYGLIVDSVENIVPVHAGHKLPVPSMLIDASQKTLRGDLKEVVEVPDAAAAAGGRSLAMMIFDVARLTERIARLLEN